MHFGLPIGRATPAGSPPDHPRRTTPGGPLPYDWGPGAARGSKNVGVHMTHVAAWPRGAPAPQSLLYTGGG